MRRLYHRFRTLIQWRRRERDLQEEIEAHLAMDAHERMEAGRTGEEARREASRDFGSVIRTIEDTRGTWGWNACERVFQDVRYALRMCRKHPGFATISALTIAIGIGSATSIFAVVDAVLLKPLPYPDPGRLVAVTQAAPAMNINRM